MATKVKTKGPDRNVEVINGRQFPYKCKCKVHSIDCVNQEMWDEISRGLYRRVKK